MYHFNIYISFYIYLIHCFISSAEHNTWHTTDAPHTCTEWLNGLMSHQINRFDYKFYNVIRICKRVFGLERHFDKCWLPPYLLSFCLKQKAEFECMFQTVKATTCKTGILFVIPQWNNNYTSGNRSLMDEWESSFVMLL